MASVRTFSSFISPYCMMSCKDFKTSLSDFKGISSSGHSSLLSCAVDPISTSFNNL